MDYFTKWVEARPIKVVSQADVIRFISENIAHRFGLSKSITAYRVTIFIGVAVQSFAKEHGIKLTFYTLLCSSQQSS